MDGRFTYPEHAQAQTRLEITEQRPSQMIKLSEMYSPNDSIVVNVAHDGTMERDIDLEIEARSQCSAKTTPKLNRSASYMLKKTSQETCMLQSLVELNKQGSPTTTTTASTKNLAACGSSFASTAEESMNSESFSSYESDSAPTCPLGVSHDMDGTMSELTEEFSHLFALNNDLDNSTDEEASYVIMEEDETTASSSTPTERPRDTTFFCLVEGVSLSSRPDEDLAPSPTEAPAKPSTGAFSGRRTFPAVGAKSHDARLSEDLSRPHGKRTQTTRMDAVLENKRMNLNRSHSSTGRRHAEPVIQKENGSKKKEQGVSFHFYGGVRAEAPPAAPTTVPALTNAAHNDSSSFALPTPAQPTPLYSALESQLIEIESLTEGIEGALSTAVLPSLMPAVIRELELLKNSAIQIRTNGTTSILAEAGRPNTASTESMRKLVMKASLVYKKIDALLVRSRLLMSQVR